MSVLKQLRPRVFCTHRFGDEQNKPCNGLLLLLNYGSPGTTDSFSFGLEQAWVSLAQTSCPLLDCKKKLKQNLHCAHTLSRISVTAGGHLHTCQIHPKMRENNLQGISPWHTVDNSSILEIRKQWKNPWIISNNKPPLRRITCNSSSTYKKYSFYTTSPDLL